MLFCITKICRDTPWVYTVSAATCSNTFYNFMMKFYPMFEWSIFDLVNCILLWSKQHYTAKDESIYFNVNFHFELKNLTTEIKLFVVPCFHPILLIASVFHFFSVLSQGPRKPDYFSDLHPFGLLRIPGPPGAPVPPLPNHILSHCTGKPGHDCHHLGQHKASQ